MLVATTAELLRHDAFFGVFEELIQDAYHSSRRTWKRGEVTTLQMIRHCVANNGDQLARRFDNARKREVRHGAQWLQESDFITIRDVIVKDAVHPSKLGELNAHFDAYMRVSHSLNAKRNPFIAPYSISPRNIQLYSNQLVSDESIINATISDLILFFRLIDDNVRVHGRNNAHGQGIRNAYLYALLYRSRLDLGRLSSNNRHISGRISYIVRLGAWLAQQTGQWHWLRTFQELNSGVITYGHPHSVVVDHALRFHERKFYSDDVQHSRFAEKAFVASVTLPENEYVDPKTGDLASFENALTEYKRRGAFLGHDASGLLDSISTDGRRKQIDYALRLHEDHVSKFGASSALNQSFVLLKSRFEMVSGLLDEASATIAPFTQTSRGRHGVSNRNFDVLFGLLSGEIEQRKTGIKDNEHLFRARIASLEMGALHRARRIEYITGARKR